MLNSYQTLWIFKKFLCFQTLWIFTTEIVQIRISNVQSSAGRVASWASSSSTRLFFSFRELIRGDAIPTVLSVRCPWEPVRPWAREIAAVWVIFDRFTGGSRAAHRLYRAYQRDPFPRMVPCFRRRVLPIDHWGFLERALLRINWNFMITRKNIYIWNFMKSPLREVLWRLPVIWTRIPPPGVWWSNNKCLISLSSLSPFRMRSFIWSRRRNLACEPLESFGRT